MRIKLPHAPYIANKIAIDLLNSGFVTLDAGVEPVAKQAEIILIADIKKERTLEERAQDILEEQEDQMQELQIDRRDMFRLVKKGSQPSKASCSHMRIDLAILRTLSFRF